MPESYVDLVYLDPPFNKNRNFAAPIGSKAAGAAFKDTWTLDDVDLTWHGELAECHPALYQTIDAAGTAHSKGMKAYLIYMAVRLLELRRVMRSTASIYLHCDPTASHYLKTLMDSVFGRVQFRNEIVWSYKKVANSRAKKFLRAHDTILFYSRSTKFRYNATYDSELSPRKQQLIRAGYNTKKMDGQRYLYIYDDAVLARKESQGKIDRNDFDVVRTVDTTQGNRHTDVFDIKFLNSQSSENVGYPTQKPLALLDRIVRASSDEGDVVLDPFCGCATACVAAERLNRQWIGIDISDMAYKLVRERLTNEVSFMGTVLHDIQYWTAESVTESQRLPKTTSYRNLLYGEQEGRCAMCSTLTEIRLMDVDHILARAEGGGDELDNLQLLCRSCNLTKGTSEDSIAKANMIAELKEKIAWLEGR